MIVHNSNSLYSLQRKQRCRVCCTLTLTGLDLPEDQKNYAVCRACFNVARRVLQTLTCGEIVTDGQLSLTIRIKRLLWSVSIAQNKRETNLVGATCDICRMFSTRVPCRRSLIQLPQALSAIMYDVCIRCDRLLWHLLHKNKRELVRRVRSVIITYGLPERLAVELRNYFCNKDLYLFTADHLSCSEVSSCIDA